MRASVPNLGFLPVERGEILTCEACSLSCSRPAGTSRARAKIRQILAVIGKCRRMPDKQLILRAISAAQCLLPDRASLAWAVEEHWD